MGCRVCGWAASSQARYSRPARGPAAGRRVGVGVGIDAGERYQTEIRDHVGRSIRRAGLASSRRPRAQGHMFPASWTPSEIAASIRSAGAARECIKRVLCPSKKNSQTTPDSEANHPNGLTTHKHSKTWRLNDGPGTPRGSRADRHYDHVRHRQRCQSDEQNLKQPIVERGRGIADQQYEPCPKSTCREERRRYTVVERARPGRSKRLSHCHSHRTPERVRARFNLDLKTVIPTHLPDLLSVECEGFAGAGGGFAVPGAGVRCQEGRGDVGDRHHGARSGRVQRGAPKVAHEAGEAARTAAERRNSVGQPARDEEGVAADSVSATPMGWRAAGALRSRPPSLAPVPSRIRDLSPGWPAFRCPMCRCATRSTPYAPRSPNRA